MFYRRKVILALLEIFNGRLEKIRLQKLLFLFTQGQTKAEYDFIPYKYGCFSYSANADLVTMVKKGQLIDDHAGFSKADKIQYLDNIKLEDKKLLLEVKRRFDGMTSNSLMKYTYLNYPYFAINSVKATELLNRDELSKIDLLRPKKEDIILFTIGYEGVSLEEYINRLIKNDVKLLVDVRKNPVSMKYGFSKSSLKKYCENIGIMYMHFPAVGIDSDQRQELTCQEDYDKLFNNYKKDNIAKTVNIQNDILNLLKQNKRIALTCFEANICQCHRKHLSEAIASLPGFAFKIQHI